jgi:hypothetical protein
MREDGFSFALLTKPVHPTDLIHVIRNICDLKTSGPQLPSDPAPFSGGSCFGRRP